jgi:plastocyanin/sugar lactone lactonase YvrE
VRTPVQPLCGAAAESSSRVGHRTRNAERPDVRSHAERGNEQKNPFVFRASASIIEVRQKQPEPKEYLMKNWLVGFTWGVAAAVMLSAGVSAARADVIEVQVRNNVFDPNFVIVNRGDTVRWVFTQGLHNTTSNDGFWMSDETLPAGSEYEVTFDGTGQYDYKCTLHVDCCNMVGTVYVLDGGNPYNVIVAGYFDSSILRFKSDGTPLEPIESAMGNLSVFAPAGFAYGPDANLYVANQVSAFIQGMDDSIVKVNPFNGDATPFIDLPSGYVPAALRFGPDGNLYVCRNGGVGAAQGSGSVDCYDGSSGAFIASVVTNLTQPTGLLFDSAGNLYVSSFGDGTVLLFDGTNVTTLVSAGSDGLVAPSGLQIGPDGNLYVADLLAGAVRVFDPSTGNSLGDFIAEGGALDQQFPSDLLFDDQGNLLVANLGNSYTDPTGSVKLFDSRGNYLSDFATGIYGAAQLLRTDE